MSTSAYYDGNSNLLKITGLKNASTNAWVVSGVTVTAKLCAVGSTTAIAAGASISLAYVAASNGNWQGTFPSDLAVVDGTYYDAVVTANGGTSLTGVWTLRVLVAKRNP